MQSALTERCVNGEAVRPGDLVNFELPGGKSKKLPNPKLVGELNFQSVKGKVNLVQNKHSYHRASAYMPNAAPPLDGCRAGPCDAAPREP